MSKPQRVDASTQHVATDERPQRYTCLLNTYAKKYIKLVMKDLTIIRSTVWADMAHRVSYTSPYTFQHHKMAENDASKIAIFATRHKLKNEALRLFREEMTVLSTAWADIAHRVSYTSPNTFQHHKMAENDASKIAIFATRHKLKNEALRHVREEMTAKAKKKLNNL
ncbi:hypothetical protein L6452_40271 [Arctium lappa]|uniref:Uncharacterized protein n=1 Tax=Arctium lappa TaxID=4217 RepID=A0ACB8XML7_ARCLA|nr:hypothetical protein L6452_40271 [Arctium lappa]